MAPQSAEEYTEMSDVYVIDALEQLCTARRIETKLVNMTRRTRLGSQKYLEKAEEAFRDARNLFARDSYSTGAMLSLGHREAMEEAIEVAIQMSREELRMLEASLKELKSS